MTMDEGLKIKTVIKKLQDKFILADKDSDVATLRIFKEDFPDEMRMDFDELGRILGGIEAGSKGDVVVESVENVSIAFSDFLRKEQIPPDLLTNKAFYRVRYINRGQTATRKLERGEIAFVEDRGIGYIKCGAGKKIRIAKRGTRQTNLLERLFTPKLGTHVKKTALYDFIRSKKDVGSTDYAQVADNTLKEINRALTDADAGFAFRLYEEGDQYWLEVDTSVGGR